MTQYIQLTEDVQWLSACHNVGDAHMHLSQYIIQSGDQYILVDAGLDYEEYLDEAIRTYTNGDGIDALLLTQSILPHTRSANEVQERWDDVSVITAASSPAIVGIHGGRSKVMNSTKDIVGREIRFLDPLLTDIVNSNWLFDTESNILFTAEGFGHYHEPGQCDYISKDFTDGIPFERIHSFHHDKLPYVQYIDPEKLRSAIDALFNDLDISLIAPVHGNPVERANIKRYLESVLRSVEKFAEAENDIFLDR